MTTPQDFEKIRQFLAAQMATSGGESAVIEGDPEYDGFVDSGTGERGYMGFKYMPSPMDAPANTAYMPPPQAAPVNTAYMPPPTAAPVNTAYMPPAPVNTTYNAPLRRSPSSASTGFNPQAAPTNTAYMPSSAPSYGMSNATTPTYGMSTPTYGMAKAPTYREQASYSPNQAGKYKVDGPRIRNTGGLFNDLNAFFGRPQT
jgi:hypothetical protein